MHANPRSFAFVAVLGYAVIGAGCSASSVNSGTLVGGATAAASALQAIPAAHKKKQQGKARIMIKIPLRKLTLTPLPFDKQHGKVNPKYISASTQSMTVVVAGVPTQTFNLTPTSPGCSTSDGSVSCSETAFFPPGQQTVTITLYDGQNGAGNQLSTASTSVTIATGAVTNISVTLNGVPTTAKVLLNGSASDSIPEGTATSVPASVSAYDADNNLIMTPGNYSSPVTLSDSDTSGATTLSSTSVSAPGAPVTLSYNGGNISSATITPSVNGTPQPSGAATLTLTTSSPAITEYSLPPSGGQPYGITTGPDGALWFTEALGNGHIGRITTGGTIAEYTVPTSASSPEYITTGPDGALWFTECTGNKIGRITTGGAITEYSVPTSGSFLFGITTGPDGALWFTEVCGNKIGRITTGGTIVEYTLPTSNGPVGIIAGPNNALWFTAYFGNKIGQITTGGAITEYTVPTSASSPGYITTGPDGALWFTECTGNKIGRITTGGAITEYPVPTGGSNPYGIITGPDGALWFTEYTGNKIGRITTGGAITEYSVPTSKSTPRGITTGPDGALWFTECLANKIGRVPVSIANATRRGERIIHAR